MITKMRKILALFLVLASSLSAFELLFAPNVMAVPAIISLDPASGYVGAVVMVSGTIDTINGTFTIRWDQKANLTTGKALGNQVAASFIVPATDASTSGRAITVELIDINASSVSSPISFTVFTKFALYVDVPQQPRQLQEGASTNMKINVTGGTPNTVYIANVTVKDPANQTHFVLTQLSNTTAIGSGGTVKTYPGDFGAHTNLTGTYFVAFNDTVATTQFFVGLTDKTEYRRNEIAHILAAGYKPSEKVSVNIKRGASSVSEFPKNLTASSGGLITLSWQVPVNATAGTYSVTLTNATSPGTAKTPTDTQSFVVQGAACFIQSRDLADEIVVGALIEVSNLTAPSVVLARGNTNSTGWVVFNLDSGNYTFKGYVNDVEVGRLSNQTITVDTLLTLRLRLVNFVASVETEKGQAVPLVEIVLRYTYKTRDNKTVTGSSSGQTSPVGKVTFGNLFTNITYRIEAFRYGMLFSNTTRSVEFLPASPLITVDLILSTCMLNVHALDSNEDNAGETNLTVYEWSSGVTAPVDSIETNLSGDASFSLPFGRYILRAYKDEVLLGEAVIDLNESLAFTFNLVSLNVGVIVSVSDFFGQPIANAEVRIERRSEGGFVFVSSQTTGSGGEARFSPLIGGDSRVSVYVNGQLVAVKTQFLGAGSSEVSFLIGGYVALAGYPVAAGAFVLLVIVLLIVAVMLVLNRSRILRMLRRQPKR